MVASVVLSLLAAGAASFGPDRSTGATQVFLSVGDPGSVRVSWALPSGTDPKTFVVKYGSDSSALDKTATPGDPTNYTYDRGDGYHYASPTLCTATMSGLEAASVVFYSIAGAPARRGAADTPVFASSFLVPPAEGEASTATLAVIGDLGQTANSSTTLAHVSSGMALNGPADGYQALVIVGDLSYADAEHSPIACHHPGGCSQERWDSWGALFQPVGAKLATMTLPGNHEIETPNAPLAGDGSSGAVTTTPFVSYSARFRAVAPTGMTPLYYSWGLGPLHCIHLNSYADAFSGSSPFSKTSPQFKWLAKDLAAVDRARTPWVAVFLHAPWYNSNKAHHNDKEEVQLRELMEPLLYQYGVDLLFAGHVHAYERTVAVLNQAPDKSGYTEINIGDGGNREGPASSYYDQPAWSAYREASFGHGRLQVVNSSHAQWTWHRNQDNEPVPADDIWLVKRASLEAAADLMGLVAFDRTPGSPVLGQEWALGRQHDGWKGPALR